MGFKRSGTLLAAQIPANDRGESKYSKYTQGYIPKTAITRGQPEKSGGGSGKTIQKDREYVQCVQT